MTSLGKSGPRVEVGTEAGSVWGVGGPGCRGRALGCTGPLKACQQSHRRGHGGPGTEWRTEAAKEAKRRRGTKTRRPDDRRGGREEGDGADVGHAGRPRGDGEGPRPFHSAPCLPEFARKRFLPVLRAANLFLLRDNFTHPREQTSALGIKPRGANRHAGKSACVDAPGYAKSPSNFHRAGHEGRLDSPFSPAHNQPAPHPVTLSKKDLDPQSIEIKVRAILHAIPQLPLPHSFLCALARPSPPPRSEKTQ